MQPTKVWQGVLVLAYKTNPLEVLLIENRNTGNITPIGGALEEKWAEEAEDAAVRETREETGWKISKDLLTPTNIYHRFQYAPTKKERAGDYASGSSEHRGLSIRRRSIS